MYPPHRVKKCRVGVVKGNSMTGWDIALICVVSAMGTAVAYLRPPSHKAFVLMLPVPFTLATLVVARPVDATNVLGLVVLFGFTLGVWALLVRWRWPVLLAIAVPAVGYCVVGAAIAWLQPTGDVAFWCAAALVLAAAIALIRTLPHRQEPHHRTPLPVWVKLPAIALVVAGLIAIKQYLGGFMTTFPMVGVVAAYEARNSPWTIVRRIPWIMMMLTLMMVVIRLTQSHLGLPLALTLAWVLLPVLLWVFRSHYTGTEENGSDDLTKPKPATNEAETQP